MTSTTATPLQRLEKFDNHVLICFAQFFKVRCDAARFAAVAKNGIAKRQGAPSCISIGCIRTPHRGAVRILLAVA